MIGLVDRLNAALRDAGLPHVAVCVPSADEVADADVEFRLGGASAPARRRVTATSMWSCIEQGAPFSSGACRHDYLSTVAES
jgi:hypothetical protein